MLSRFYCSNFKSFNETVEFSLVPGTEKRHKSQVLEITPSQKLLKNTIVYGANSSGKSNLVKAIDFSQDLILNGINPVIDYSTEYHRNILSNAQKTSTFQYEIVIGKTTYLYGFDILLTEKKIESEWLYEYKKNEYLPIFLRINNERKFDCPGLNIKNDETKNKINVYFEDILDDNENLIIKVISKKNLEIQQELKVLTDIFNWFKNIQIVYPDTIVTDFFKVFSKNSKAQSTHNTNIVRLLEFFDTGIKNYELINSSLYEIEKNLPSSVYQNFKNGFIKAVMGENESGKVREKLTGVKSTINSKRNIFEVSFDCKGKNNQPFDFDNDVEVKKLVFTHSHTTDDDGKVYYTFNEESDGTKRLIELLDVILNDDNEKIIIIDEIDRSLHPMLTRKFLELYDSFTNNKNKQLIVTTHESTLLDQDLVRRDSIWFVERNNKNASELLSLDSFKERYDKKLEKAYFEGRYGGIPVFKEFLFICNEKKGDLECL